MKSLIDDIVKYNVWANTGIISLFKYQKEDVSHNKIVSSFPSVRETLQHIWFAEMIWLSRLCNNPISKDDFMNKTSAIPIHLFFDGLLETSKIFETYVLNLTEQQLRQTCHYANTMGTPFQQSYYEIIQHCMNHSTYHRGQLVMMARQLNINQIESTDYITYLRKKSKSV